MVNNLFEDLRDTQIIVDTAKIGKNMSLIKDMVGDDVDVMAVIKANGYGHGAVGIAPALMNAGAYALAVATLTEALELKVTATVSDGGTLSYQWYKNDTKIERF